VSEQNVTVSRAGDICLVHLSRPGKVNAVTKAGLRDLARAIRDAEGARGIVIAGEGSNFSSGFDLDERTGTAADEEIDDLLQAVGQAIEDAPVPVMAAVEGACVGAGFDIATMCDLVVAGGDAFFGVPAVRLGIVYREPTVARIVRQAGRQAATLVFLLGQRLDATTALQVGLVAEVVATGAAERRSVELLADVAEAPPDIVARTKSSLRRS
jgi:enoyl-CoA hydratase